jgi:hypothetical protein
MLSSSAAFPRPRARVQAMQGAVVRRLALRARVEGTQGRGRRHALARPGLAPCALWRVQGMPGRVWARRFLPVAVRFFIESVLGLAQVSEGKVMDMMVRW